MAFFKYDYYNECMRLKNAYNDRKNEVLIMKNEQKSPHLAVDIGASSGRLISGQLQNGKIHLEEIYRFENELIQKNSHLCWDIDRIKEHVITGIKKAHDDGLEPTTIGIDTWGCDFVLLDTEGNRIGDSVSYRDSRTDGIRDFLESEGILSFRDLYAKTGIQYLQFNTIYQLVALKNEHPEQLERAETFLMIPDYLNYILCGVLANEYTNATTTALVNAETHQWDDDLIQRLGLPRKIFKPLSMPGKVLGHFTDGIKKQTGTDMAVILPATHDTGSAFLSVPARDERSVFLSSGTWSLMGVENRKAITSVESEQANFTNEGGYDYRYRYLKNIMGLWMIQSVRREISKKSGVKPSFPELIEKAKERQDIKTFVSTDDRRFLASEDMREAVRQACQEKGEPIPDETGAVMAVIYNSLSRDYQKTVKTLEKITGKIFTAVNIVGGGSQDMYLSQKTADACGLPVLAGPTEGTALGNLIVQMLYEKEFPDLQTARDTVRESFDIKTVLPKNKGFTF